MRRDVEPTRLLASHKALACGLLALLALSLERLREGHARRLQTVESEEDRVQRCRLARQPQVYDPIFHLEPVAIEFCGEIEMNSLLGTNAEVSSISFVALTQTAEVVTLVEKGGPIYQLNVLSDGDRARWDIQRPAVRTFGGNSCLDFTQFCEVASITPLLTGFVVVDRHRLQEFNVSWSESESTEVILHTWGKMNMEAPDQGLGQLHFPTYLAVYQPVNSTHISDELEITPLYPHARERYFFVSDTGNHRIMLINATRGWEHDPLGQYDFGVMGETRSNSSGLNTPMGLAVMVPTDESFFGPVMAAVFVADRRNNRVVKLLLGYRNDPSIPMYRDEKPRLMWGGEYYRNPGGAHYNESLFDPVGVSVYKNQAGAWFIFVCEAEGNAITVLVTNYVQHDELIFVTELYPPPGIQLTGSFSTTENGYLWFGYIRRPSTHGLASWHLSEPLVVSPPPSWIQEFRAQCTNATVYNLFIMANSTVYDEHVLQVLNAARINWRFPYLPGYISKDSFNLTLMFDLVLWNETVLQGNMFYCLPPPPETTPPMLSANEDGWNTPGGGGVLLTADSYRCLPGLLLAVVYTQVARM